VKVTTEKLPRSLIALDVELDHEQVEKGLERAARRISQKYNIPGFRKGKAPRFIVENYFGRPMLLEEATDDLINKAFQEALKQEGIDPIGKADLENVNLDQEPFSFRVTVPVAPSVTIADYRSIRAAAAPDAVTDETVERAMDARRDKHAVLKELEEPRPAQQGDELSVELEAIVDGAPLEQRPEGQPPEPSTMVLEQNRLADGLFEALVGAEVDRTIQVTSMMTEEHANEKLRGKEVTFIVKVLGIKERLLPDWEELPTLEEFEGDLDALREKTRTELIESAKNIAERDSMNGYLRELLDQSSFDIPDALIEREADQILQQQEQEYARYGVKPEQVYAYRGQKREDLVAEMLPQAEERIKTTLALQEIIRSEGMTVDESEIAAELEEQVAMYDEEQRDRIRTLLSSGEFRSMISSTALDKKLRAYLLDLANSGAPDAEPSTEAVDASPASIEG
jgi:trigger factor